MKSLSELLVKWTGIEPIILHRGDLADPMDEYTRKISAQAKVAKKDRTPEAYNQLYKLEWLGSSYQDPEIGWVLPTDNVLKGIIEGARRAKLGKAVEAAVFVRGIPPDGDHESIKLNFPGSRDPETMWANGTGESVYKKTLRVGQQRIVRCRPRFKTWSIEFSLRFDSEIIEKSSIVTAMNACGRLIGLGDWHPRFGTFDSEIIDG